jgi:hypothetical protein
VFVVLKFFGRGREKACLLTNHKVKIWALVIKATVYKLTVAANERCNQRAHRGTTQLELFIISIRGLFIVNVCLMIIIIYLRMYEKILYDCYYCSNCQNHV